MRILPAASAAVAAAALLVCAPGALAQEKPVDPYTPSDANADVAPMTDDAVFQAFHGKAGVDRIVHRLNWFHNNDPRLSDVFKAADNARLERTLSEMICYILGGPCHYTGREMKDLHKDMGVQTYQMNVQIEDLQRAMAEEHVPVWAQNKLLGKLAPLKRVIVVR